MIRCNRFSGEPVLIAGYLSAILFALILSGMIFCQSTAYAQDLPEVAQGLNPNSTYLGSDIDLVDMVTGRLNLHIPLLVDHSQRGDLNFTYSLYFSGQSWYQKLINCYPTYCRYGWFLARGTNKGVVFGIDGHIGSGTSIKCTVQVCGYNATELESLGDDGSVHPLGTISGGYESIDGSGIRQITNSQGFAVFTKGDGIQAGLSSYNINTGASTKFIEDTNGNEITFNSTTGLTVMTDTLGRSWTQTFGSTSVTGCPTGGPVAPTSSTIWTVPGPTNINNGVRQFKFCFSSVMIQTHFGVQNVVEYGATWTLMTGVVLPDGTTWRFDYNSYGDPATIVLPTGGTTTYQWRIGDLCGTGISTGSGNGLEILSQRTVFDGANSNTWQYNAAPNGGSGGVGGVRVTDPLGNDTVHFPAPITRVPFDGGQSVNSCSMGTGTIQYFAGSYNSGTLLKTVTNNYMPIINPYSDEVGGPSADPIVLTGITTSYSNRQTLQMQQTNDPGFIFTDANPGHSGQQYTGVYGLVTSKSESDFYTGNPSSIPWLLSTSKNYLALSNSSYLNAHLLTLVSSATALTSPTNGNKCSETDFGYDEYSLDSSGVTEQHLPAPNSVMGNQTSVTQQVFSNPCTSANPSMTPEKTTYHVYDTGMTHTTTDPLGNPPRTYSYSGTYYGAFPTSVCNPLNQCTNYGYDFNTGLMTSLQDPNSQTTNFVWDIMMRPTQANYPDGGQTRINYNYSGNVFVGDTVTKTATPSPNFVTAQIFDGLGRLKETQVASDPSGTQYTDITYDADGRKYKVWNPTRCNPPQTNNCETTWGFTTYNYDALNRVTSVVEQDGSTVTTDYSQVPCTTVTDEAGKKRKSCSDGLGRMTSVSEDPSNLNYQTNYGYNALGDLLSVTQSGSRQRSFAYDSLSRLTQASNPESGTINYTYDANGNVSTKIDARNITTTNTYDALNRLTGKAYSDGTTSASFMYDLNALWGVTMTNTTGRLAAMATATTDAMFSYDAMGRVVAVTGCTPVSWHTANPYYAVAAVYDLMGNVTQLTYPSGRIVKEQYDGAAHLTQVRFDSFSGTSVGYNYLSGASYAPTGAPTSLTLGSGTIETENYDSRLQPTSTQVAMGATSWLNRSSGYGATGQNNGNVMSIADNLQPNRTQSFTYDSLNRISTAQSAATSGADCWGQSFGYDAWANLLSETLSKCSGTQLSLSVNTQNRITNSGFSYDPAGDPLTDGINSYAYDGEGRITTLNGSGATYSYDAQGHRVLKQIGSDTTEYIYFDGQVMGERKPNGDWSDYVYIGSRRISRSDDFMNELNIAGTNSTNSQASTFVLANAGGLVGYTIRSGDRLLVEQYQWVGTEGGVRIDFTDGTLTNWIAKDQFGDYMNQQTASGVRQRIIDLSAFAGKQVSAMYLVSEVGTAAGNWDATFKQFSLANTDGTAYSIFNNSPTYGISFYWTNGATNQSSGVNNWHNRFDPDTTVSYYHSDYLGSARLMTGNSGWPIWQTTYLPFGQEWNPQATVNHYKFTGKERDSESGLDNFGARYDSSQYGRFMTPDPIGIMKQKLTDPQQWNMYSYARNNPLRFMDPTGKYNTDCKSKNINQCSSDIQAYDANVKNQLNSKSADVRAAAQAVGTFNDGNNVNVKFDPNAKDAGKTVQDTDANGKPTGSVTVTFRSMSTNFNGKFFTAHEGSHVVDFENTLKGMKPLTLYQSEVKAYTAASGILLDQPNPTSFYGYGDRITFRSPLTGVAVQDNEDAAKRLVNRDYGLNEDNQGGYPFVEP